MIETSGVAETFLDIHYGQWNNINICNYTFMHPLKRFKHYFLILQENTYELSTLQCRCVLENEPKSLKQLSFFCDITSQFCNQALHKTTLLSYASWKLPIYPRGECALAKFMLSHSRDKIAEQESFVHVHKHSNLSWLVSMEQILKQVVQFKTPPYFIEVVYYLGQLPILLS